VSAPFVVRGFPPSPVQRRLAALAEWRGGGRASAALRLPAGAGDPALVARALGVLAARHEILRTRLIRPPGMAEPLQVIADPGELPILFEVWPAVPAADAAILDELLGTLELRAGEAPLAAALVPDGGDGAPLLLVSLPASAADAASFDLLASELDRALAGGASGEEPMQYADYAAWHNEVAGSAEAGRDAEAFARLDLPALLAARLPGERAAAPGPGSALQEIGIERAPSDLAAAARLAAAAGVAVEDLLLAAWGALLWRLSAQPRIALFPHVSGRDFAELESALGAFARHLPVVLAPEEPETLPELARRAARELAEARERGDGFSWERLAAGSGVDAEELGPAWAFDAGNPHAAGRVAVVARRLAGERSTVELAFPAGVAAPPLAVRYDPARYTAAAARRLAERLLALVRAAAARPDAPLAELPMLAAAERAELLVERNATAVDFGPERRLHRLFATRAAATPERPAVRCGGAAWTYAELAAAAGRVARRLRRAGVGPEVPVAILAERSLELIAGLLGILEAGGCFVPLDPEHPAERTAYMLEASGTRFVLAQGALAHAVPNVPTVPVVTLEEALAEPAGGEFVQPAVDSANLAYVLFTSGSTGRPKGVAVSHCAIANRILWTLAEHPLDVADRLLQKTPVTFDASLWEIFAPLFAGALLAARRAPADRRPRAARRGRGDHRAPTRAVAAAPVPRRAGGRRVRGAAPHALRRRGSRSGPGARLPGALPAGRDRQPVRPDRSGD
jgi:non-ribosomal peptide synthetase component F